MKIIKKHHSAFIRQVSESVIIINGTRDKTMNSKSEWFGERIPRLTVEIGETVNQKDHDGSTLVKNVKMKDRKTKMTRQTGGATKRCRMDKDDEGLNQDGKENPKDGPPESPTQPQDNIKKEATTKSTPPLCPPRYPPTCWKGGAWWRRGCWQDWGWGP